MPKIPLIGVAGEGFSSEANARRCVNLVPHVDDAGGKERLIWLPAPGTKAFGEPSAVLRGNPVKMGDYIYYVAGANLYRMDSGGTESASLGTLDTSSGNVSMVANRTQVAIVDGDSTNRKIYVYDTTDGFHEVTGFSTEKTATSIQQISSKNITSITGTPGPTYTVLTASPHLGYTGDYVTITGATVPAFDGVWQMTKVDADEFTIQVSGGPADAGAAGTARPHRYTVQCPSHEGAESDTVRIVGSENFDYTYDTVSGISWGMRDVSANNFTIGGPDLASDPDNEVADVTAYISNNANSEVMEIQPQFIAYMDSYGIVNNSRNNTDDAVSDHEFYVSVGDDFRLWIVTTSDSAQREPDALVRPFPFFGELYLLGETSTEVWYNAGTGLPPFEPARNAASQWGCTSGWTVTPVGDTFCFLGELDGQPTVLMMSGYQIVDVANQRIQNVIRQQSRATLTAATAFSLRTKGHEWYCLQFDSGTTYVFDHAMTRKSGMPVWWEWQSYGDVAFVGKWYVYAFGKHLIADSTAAYIYEIDWDTATELDETTARAIKRVGTSGFIHADDKGVIHNHLYVDLDTGSAGGDITLEYSEDGGGSWVGAGSRHWSGNGDRLEWFADDLGGYTETDRVYRLTVDQSLSIPSIIGAYVDVEVCEF